MRVWIARSSGVVLALAWAGCAGGDPGRSAAAESALLADEASPLESVVDWHGASPGCEGRLDVVTHFAVAAAGGGLVVAVDATGTPVCIDTVGAVEEELEESGREEEADGLAAAYAATAAIEQARRESGLVGARESGDPDPEPNLDARRVRHPSGDPDPEPN